jgi:hypothetical protein
MQHSRVGVAAETNRRRLSDKTMTLVTQQQTEALTEVLPQYHHSLSLPGFTLSCLVKVRW